MGHKGVSRWLPNVTEIEVAKQAVKNLREALEAIPIYVPWMTPAPTLADQLKDTLKMIEWCLDRVEVAIGD